MLEWLKDILQNAYTEEIDERVCDEIGRGFVARADFNAANEAKKKLQAQLNAAGAPAQSEDWERRYHEDTAALQQQIAQLTHSHSAQLLAAQARFSSEAARKAFLADLAAVQLPMENGTLTGFDAFLQHYRETDPGAFAAENNRPALVQFEGNPSAAPAVAEGVYAEMNRHRIVK